MMLAQISLKFYTLGNRIVLYEGQYGKREIGIREIYFKGCTARLYDLRKIESHTAKGQNSQNNCIKHKLNYIYCNFV